MKNLQNRNQEKMEEHKELFIKYLDGHCTATECQQVHRLLETEEGNRMLFMLFEQRAMEVRKPLQQEEPVMKKLTIDKREELFRRIRKGSANDTRLLSRTVFRRIAVAAAFVGIILLAGTLLLNNKAITNPLEKASAIQLINLTNPHGSIPQTFQLPDGTHVWLAAGSTLQYPEAFAKKYRDVTLTGEAFFDVARDENRPFTIHSGDMETRVLGTSFKITAFAGQEQEVAVATGKVSVSSVNAPANSATPLALLTRGTSIRYNPATGQTTQGEVNPQSLEEWKAGKLIFNKMPMQLVAKLLENRYGIEIKFINQEASARRVSGSVNPGEPITTILRLLSRTGKFKYESNDEKCYIIH